MHTGGVQLCKEDSPWAGDSGWQRKVSFSQRAHFLFPLLSRVKVLVNFVECLGVSGPILKHFAYRNPCNPPNNPIQYYYAYFPDKGTE